MKPARLPEHAYTRIWFWNLAGAQTLLCPVHEAAAPGEPVRVADGRRIGLQVAARHPKLLDYTKLRLVDLFVKICEIKNEQAVFQSLCVWSY